MRWALRCVFAALAALTLAIQVTRTDAADAAVGRRLDSRIAALGLNPRASASEDVLDADAPGCVEPVRLARIGFNGLGRADASALLDGGAVPRFVYLGFAGPRLDAAEVAARWALAGTLHALRLRNEAAPLELMLVAIPAACPELAALDWSAVSPWRSGARDRR